MSGVRRTIAAISDFAAYRADPRIEYETTVPAPKPDQRARLAGMIRSEQHDCDTVITYGGSGPSRAVICEDRGASGTASYIVCVDPPVRVVRSK